MIHSGQSLCLPSSLRRKGHRGRLLGQPLGEAILFELELIAGFFWAGGCGGLDLTGLNETRK
jgi:hypothetical protein